MSEALDFAGKRDILAVDDVPENLNVISGVLRPHYKVRVAPSGARALQICFSDDPPDLVLLDIEMPEMDGYEVLRRLTAAPETAGIPVIFVTARDTDEDEQVGLDLGAVDYITKPISPGIVLARVRTHLLLKEARDYLQDEKRFLTYRLSGAQSTAIEAFAALAAMRDDESPKHILRMQAYVRALADALHDHPRYAAFVADHIDLLVESVPVHDIGKVGVSDRFLYGIDDADGAALDAMKAHPTIGRDVIDRVQRRMGADAGFLRVARDIAYSHHEKWDGSGYPQGLRGDDIPIPARLVALADVYDALTRGRAHGEPTSHEDAAGIIAAAGGTHFDPDVVDAFRRGASEFRAIAARYAETEAELAAREV
ncbi:MAG TPA: response regulator [Burkholderiales bacterium]|nr:response regulator [Burkholderiales bacterium]